MKSILFTPDNALAIHEGRKTQTRRVSKLDKINVKLDDFVLEDVIVDPPMLFQETGTYAYFHRRSKTNIQHVIRAPFEIDQILYVKENWRLDDIIPYRREDPQSMVSFRVRYAGDRNQPQHEIWMKESRYRDMSVMHSQGWKPSIFMPVEVARLFVRITDVRLQQLHDISDDDVLAEGFSMHGENKVSYTELGGKKYFDFAYLGWKWLWESVNGPGSYEKNVWLWAFSFEKVENPV